MRQNCPCVGPVFFIAANMGRLKRRGSQGLLTQIRSLGTSLTKFLQSCQRNVGTNGDSRSHQ